MGLTIAAHGVCFRVIDLEQAIDSSEFQGCSHGRWDCGEFDVTIAFYGFFQATEQHLNDNPVDLVNS
jgi:hypothetical protein